MASGHYQAAKAYSITLQSRQLLREPRGFTTSARLLAKSIEIIASTLRGKAAFNEFKTIAFQPFTIYHLPITDL